MNTTTRPATPTIPRQRQDPDLRTASFRAYASVLAALGRTA